jgi:hypothetical protein
MGRIEHAVQKRQEDYASATCDSNMHLKEFLFFPGWHYTASSPHFTSYETSGYETGGYPALHGKFYPSFRLYTSFRWDITAT